MKLFILMIKHIIKNPFSLFLVIIQITFAMVILLSSVGKINYIKFYGSILENSEKNCFYLTMNKPDMMISDDNERNSAIENNLNGILKIKGVQYIYSTQHLSVKIDSFKNESIPMITYPKNEYFNYKPLLSSGKWIYDINSSSNSYPVVIGGIYAKLLKTGDRFIGEILGNKYTFIVCGILKEPNLLLDFNQGGNYINWGMLTKEYPNIIISRDIYINGKLVSGSVRSLGLFVKIKDGFTGTALTEAKNNLSNYGTLLSFNKINEISNNIIKDKINKYTYNYILLILMGTLGIIGVSVLNCIKDISSFSVWYICGSKWMNLYILNFLRLFIIIAISILFSIFILSSKFASEILLINSLISAENYLFTGLVYFLIITISILFIIRVIRNNSPIDLMRRFQAE